MIPKVLEDYALCIIRCAITDVYAKSSEVMLSSRDDRMV